MACCPAHDDRNPSLSIRECSSGHILINCFAGCERSDVVASIGMTMAELMPERDAHYFDDQPPKPREREPRGEANLAKIQIRYLTATAMVEGGHKLTQPEKKQAIDDYEYLRRVGQLL